MMNLGLPLSNSTRFICTRSTDVIKKYIIVNTMYNKSLFNSVYKGIHNKKEKNSVYIII